jgi:hypothetical protein
MDDHKARTKVIFSRFFPHFCHFGKKLFANIGIESTEKYLVTILALPPRRNPGEKKVPSARILKHLWSDPQGLQGLEGPLPPPHWAFLEGG